jgi:hypothetical protein
MFVFVAYVTIEKLADLTGYTAKAIRRKIERREFIEGLHYRRAPDGRVLMDVKQFNEWIKGNDYGQETKMEARRAG